MSSEAEGPEDPTAPRRENKNRRHVPHELKFTVLPPEEPEEADEKQPQFAKTPSLSETYSEIRRNLSFKNLNRNVSSENIRNVVWRRGGRDEPGEERFQPENLEKIVVHSARGAFRAAVIGCSLRANVNLVSLVLERILRRGKVSARLILHALFGKDTIRFGGMLGLFVLIYKFTLHSLRLYNPFRKEKNKEEYYHAAIAGALSGLSVIAEKRSRRITLGQQMFVRGLQGYYNNMKRKGIVDIPNGDVLLFGLSCANIMYAWLVSLFVLNVYIVNFNRPFISTFFIMLKMVPSALSPGYSRWVTNASRICPEMPPVNLSLTKYGTFDSSYLYKLLETRGEKAPTKHNREFIEQLIERAKEGDYGLRMADCPVVHPWIDSCRNVTLDRFLDVFRFMLPVYGALHFIPPVLLRFKNFKKDPSSLLLRSLKGTLRSCAFLASFVAWFQTWVCIQRQTYHFLDDNHYWRALRDAVAHRYYYFILGFSTCISLFIEEKKRRGELAMYVLPRGLEAMWALFTQKVPFARGKHFSAVSRHGDVFLASVGLSMVMSIYHHDPKSLSGLVRSIVYQFVGHS